jgi:hypothetical protein
MGIPMMVEHYHVREKGLLILSGEIFHDRNYDTNFIIKISTLI